MKYLPIIKSGRDHSYKNIHLFYFLSLMNVLRCLKSVAESTRNVSLSRIQLLNCDNNNYNLLFGICLSHPEHVNVLSYPFNLTLHSDFAIIDHSIRIRDINRFHLARICATLLIPLITQMDSRSTWNQRRIVFLYRNEIILHSLHIELQPTYLIG